MELLGILAEHFHLVAGGVLDGAALEFTGSIAHIFFQEALQFQVSILDAILSEIANGYNFNKLTADGKNYDTILPAGLAFVTPAASIGGVAPVQTFSIGGMTSMSGNNVATGEVLTRYDLKIAAGVADPSAIAVINDTNLSTIA